MTLTLSRVLSKDSDPTGQADALALRRICGPLQKGVGVPIQIRDLK